MKLKNLLIIAILFSSCTTTDLEVVTTDTEVVSDTEVATDTEVVSDTEVATDSQRNWCLGQIYEYNHWMNVLKPVVLPDEIIEIWRFREWATNIYNHDNKSSEENNNIFLVSGLLEKTTEAMRVCKIWTDIADVD